MTPQRDRPDRRAPDGTSCGEHPERPALATCPQCAGHACIECWHPAVDRCHACVQRDPAKAAPPVPWEQAQVGVGRRVLDTLATALQPVRTAPAFGRPEIAPAIRFALVVTLPIAMLRGVIPFTQTLLFKEFSIIVQGNPSGAAIATDIARAMGISVLLTAALLLALAVPFASLARAYGNRLALPAAVRVVLYRSWLVPVASWLVPSGSQAPIVPGLLFGVVLWGMPEAASSTLVWAVVLIDMSIPLLILLASMRATARLATGAGPLVSFLVVGLPLVVLFLVQGMLLSVADSWLPEAQVAAGAAVDSTTRGAP